jgi:hypothetical protein
MSELPDGRGGGGGRGAESYECKKFWPSVTRSILSGVFFSEEMHKYSVCHILYTEAIHVFNKTAPASFKFFLFNGIPALYLHISGSEYTVLGL